MAKTLSSAVLVSSAANTAGSTTRGRLDCTSADGGMIRWKLTNGATGPSTACEARVLVARKQASMPSAAAEGTGDDDWKIIAMQSGGVIADIITRGFLEFGPEVAYIEIEFTGNTGQSVTVECTGDTYAY